MRISLKLTFHLGRDEPVDEVEEFEEAEDYNDITAITEIVVPFDPDAAAELGIGFRQNEEVIAWEVSHPKVQRRTSV
jgi:hypothetical protein